MDPLIDSQVKACLNDTRRFWDNTAGERFLPRMRRYVTERLPLELELASKRGGLPDLRDLAGGRCGVLVLLVGHSYEPLLQAICAYQPTEIIPVLNAEYGPGLSGSVMHLRLKQLLTELQRAGLISLETSLRNCSLLSDDTPTAVFRFLLDHLKEDWEKQSIVIDITGAKKSMVAGAFFFAAYSNIPISYVDFDLYDEERGRPYGCTCRIGLIDNPYRDFRLRDWARVRRLYDNYAFSAAREELARICADMGRSALWDDSKELAARRLLAYLEMYEAWDSGDYVTAHTHLNTLTECLSPEAIPSAVQILGRNWPAVAYGSSASQAAIDLLDAHLARKHGNPDPEDSIFAEPRALLAYARDELSKIERLVQFKEDYRGAYLRAVGLDEFLLKARLAFCWLKGTFKLNGKPLVRDFVSAANWRRWFSALVDDSGSDRMRRVLLRQYGHLCLKIGRQDELRLELSSSAPILEPYWRDLPLDWDRGQQRGHSLQVRLRGEAIHTHLYLTEEIANGALVFAQAAVGEFATNWLAWQDKDIGAISENLLTVAPEWESLSRWCGIDFLPPYRDEED